MTNDAAMLTPIDQAIDLEGIARRVDVVIDEALAEQRVVGAVVLIAVDGDTIYSRAAGDADREAARSMRRSSGTVALLRGA